MSDKFDMPLSSAGWPARANWLVRRLMGDLELTDTQAAAIVGNLGYESKRLTTLQEEAPAVPGSRGGYGWAQWTGPRRRQFEAWSQGMGLVQSSDRANYGFLVHELQTTQAHSLRALCEAIGLHAEVFAFGRWFEAPGGTTDKHLPGFEDRLAYAKQALASVPREVADDNIDETIIEFIDTAEALQIKLAARKLYQHKIDGDWGPWSREALTAYLRSKG